MGFLDKLRSKSAGGAPTTVLLNGGGLVKGVGESHYQDAYAKVCGPKTEQGHLQHVTVTLVPEPENPYDGNAVAIYVEGEKLAHLPKAEAAAYQPMILGLVRKGTTVQCRGVIRGGWARKGGKDEGGYGILLALSAPERCLPPKPALEWEGGDDPGRTDWLRCFQPPTGKWGCGRCGRTWSKATPVPATWSLLADGPQVCPDCGSYAFTYPVP